VIETVHDLPVNPSLRRVLLELQHMHGSFDAVAKIYDVNRDYLYRLFKGERTQPSPEFLKKLGIKVEYKLDEESSLPV